MEIEKLSDFLQNCCRVCLAIENEMVDSTNIVENFNKTIDELLFECADMKMLSGTKDGPNLVCEECTGELVMVAKFREKCQMSTTALNELTKQLGQKTKTINLKLISTQNSLIIEDPGTEILLDTNTENIKNVNCIEDSVDYNDESVEYVIFDSSQDLIEENEEIERIDEQSIGLSEENASEKRRNDSSSSKPHRKTARRKVTVSKRKNMNSVETELNRCHVCGAGFAQLKNLTRHLQTHSDADTNELNRFACTTCDELFTDLTDWIEHQKKHGSNVDKTESESTSVDEPMSKRHVCQFCGRSFPSISLLTTHVRIHTNERPFKCDKAGCNKAFKTRGALDLHLRRHNGIRPFKCTLCAACFVESSNLKVHMRTHTGDKPHQCLICNRKFSRVFLLQIHQRTHTGEKPFACDCGKSFAQQGDLAAHKRIHSGERPHKCSVCSKAFIKSSGLTQHMKRHEKPTSSSALVSKRAKTKQAATSDENVQIEIINLNKDQDDSSQTDQVVICYSEPFTEYI